MADGIFNGTGLFNTGIFNTHGGAVDGGITLSGTQSTSDQIQQRPEQLITVEFDFKLTSKLSHIMSNTVTALSRITTSLAAANPFGTFSEKSKLPFPKFNLKARFEKIFRLEKIEFVLGNLDLNSILLYKLLKKKMDKK